MRAAGEGRNGKFDTTRVVGIGMMLSGVLAFTFAVAGPSGAGATSGAVTPQHVECQQTSASGTMGEVAQAISRGCGNTSTTYHQCGCGNTTTTYHQCGCGNTTTTYGDTTTTESTTSTTTSTTMAPSTSLAGETSTLATTTTVPEDTTTTAGLVGSTTTTEDTSVSAGNVTTSIGVEGSTATLPPAIQTSPTSGVLPFTGGSPAPLAGLGLVLLGTGAGLSRRKRRLAD